MESARMLFPTAYNWTAMRATADVLASVQQYLVYYVSPVGSKRCHELNTLRNYEEKLIALLECQIADGGYPRSEAQEAIEMLSDYSNVQSEKCRSVLAC
jgi:hypothetical protein